MRVLAVFGSPRKNGNSARMLEAALQTLPESAEIRRVYVAEKNIAPCCATRDCQTLGYCPVEDDMQRLYRDLDWAEVILFATSSQFGDVSAPLKAFMERTWPLRGTLKNKIGGYVVAGRRYVESSINTLHAFMLRHNMILGGRGAIGYGYHEGDIENDPLAFEDARKMAKRVVEVYRLLCSGRMERPVAGG